MIKICMRNASLAAANWCGRWLLIFSLLLGGCVSSPIVQTAPNPAVESQDIWLEVMFQNRRERLTPEETIALQQYLEGVEIKTPPEGSPSPTLKYRVRIDVGRGPQLCYFKDDGSLMLSKSRPKKADEIQRLIASVASRMPEAK